MIGLLSIGLVAGTITTSLAISRANVDSTPKAFTPEIKPTKPGRGETVSFLPESLSKFIQMEDLVSTYPERKFDIGELTPYTDELASWTSHMGDSESEKNIRRELFKKYDLFQPTNNILSWDSKIEAKNYKVIVSQDKTFSTIEREIDVSGNENSVLLKNPYTGVDYYWQVIAIKNDDTKVYSDIFKFTVSNLPRTILLGGVSNTRDLGGNIGLNGKRMKQGLIYRGMGLEAIETAEIDEFKNELGIKTEIDLRATGEGHENYLSLPNYYHCPSPFDYTNGSGDAFGIETMGEGSLVGSFGNAIKALANKDNYPAYFHCSIGRDRTGWLGMCLDLLCGVNKENILKELMMSIFSAAGALPKSNIELYNRFNRVIGYIESFNGDNLSEKMEDYLVTMAGVTHEECENVRKILLGDIDTGFVPGKENADSYADLAKVTFRVFGQSPIIKMVEVGSKIDEPEMSGNGAWYHGDDLWDFDNDIVEEDMYLDYIAKDKCKVSIHYSGIDLADEVIDVAYNTALDFTMFNKEGYSFKVYDDAYHLLNSVVVTDDISINVAYSSNSGFIPKSNSRIVVMAGQSNAAGVGHYQFLEKSLDESKISEINNGYENVLLTGYSHGEYINEFRKVYADRRSATSLSPGSFGFEIGLADRLSKAYPDETTYIVKYAYGGASLNYDWVSPSCYNIPVVPELVIDGKDRGWLYTGLVDSLTSAIAQISEMTNTIPMVEAFMWMQGESDAVQETALNLYLNTFNTMMNDFYTEFEDNISYKFALYDAAICETSIWPLAKQMNAIKRSRIDDKNIYIDTVSRLTTSFEPIGSVTDNAHYDAACYIDLGHMFADAYLTKTLKGYTYNSLEIEAPAKITLRMGQTFNIVTPTVLFNGNPVIAKMSYFAEQHLSNNNVTWYFKVNDDDTLTPTKVGNSRFRITAYYNNEVRTVIVPVQVVNY